ncbi:MAG: hypothetical protein VB140_06020 [Burkholderia sp.]
MIRNPFVSPEIMHVDAIASSRSIYATTPPYTREGVARLRDKPSSGAVSPSRALSE